jgi:rubrerythrin
MKRVSDLTEAEVLALAVSNEEEDSRIYMNFAHRLREEYPSTAQMFEEMAAEEQGHKNMLLDMYSKRFGERMPYITRQDVKGFIKRRPLWLMENMRVDAVRRQAEMMELEATRFYEQAASNAKDVEVRKLLGDLALIEQGHEKKAAQIEATNVPKTVREEEERAARKLFILQIVQPGLAGLIDGSISTMAPIFAAAFATHVSHDALVVGLAASVGAGISMGITEAMSDDGKISGRGHPLIRGAACGIMTAVGGLGHTIPYLISDFWTATALAGVVVLIELMAISWIRWKYMDTPFYSAGAQVVLGGLLVIATGILIGSS